LRAKEGEMKGEMDAVLKKVAEEREREQAEYEAKRREIEGKMAMTQVRAYNSLLVPMTMCRAEFCVIMMPTF
jgi:hypothetical protein